MRRWFVRCVLGRAGGRRRPAAPSPHADPPLLLRDPTVSRTRDRVHLRRRHLDRRRGAAAKRTGSSPVIISRARRSSRPTDRRSRSPAIYDGNTDVYVVSASGGEPRRLTYHPRADVAVGWTPDGKRVLFRSARASYSDPRSALHRRDRPAASRSQLPLPMARDGSYSPDGTHLAYVPNFQWEPFWKGYRGGQTTYVWIANLADSSTVAVPRNGLERQPADVGRRPRLLPLRPRRADHAVRVRHAHAQGRQASIKNDGFDITSASAGSRRDRLLAVRRAAPVRHRDRVAASRARQRRRRPGRRAAALGERRRRRSSNAAISPTGVRAAFEAHGDILTVPAEQRRHPQPHQDAGRRRARPGLVARRQVDRVLLRRVGRVHAAHPRSARARAAAQDLDSDRRRRFTTRRSGRPTARRSPTPTSGCNLWYVDLDHPTPVKVATAPYGDFGARSSRRTGRPTAAGSRTPMQLDNFLHAIFVYSLDARRIAPGHRRDERRRQRRLRQERQVSVLHRQHQHRADGQRPRHGEPTDASAAAVYAAVLQARPSLAARAAERRRSRSSAATRARHAAPRRAPPAPAASKPRRGATARPKFGIDFDGILQRIVALPVEEANYIAISAGKAGRAVPAQGAARASRPGTAADRPRAVRPQVAQGQADSCRARTASCVAADGDHLLYTQAHRWFIATGEPAGAARAKARWRPQNLEVYVDPRKQWAQMYRETWRIERDFFYDPHYHGLDIAAAEQRFAAVSRRAVVARRLHLPDRKRCSATCRSGTCSCAAPAAADSRT